VLKRFVVIEKNKMRLFLFQTVEFLLVWRKNIICFRVQDTLAIPLPAVQF